MSPPPITTTSLPSEFNFPLSKFSTLSPNPFLFEAVKKSIAGKIFPKLFPGISISLALYTPVAINNASCLSFISSKLAFFPTSKFWINFIPPSKRSFVLLSTTNFSNLKLGIP